MVVRPYANTDHAACLAVFNSNVPLYFAAAERPDYERHLDAVDPVRMPYLVIVADGSVVAAGGLTIHQGHRTASLDWGMVDRQHQRQRLGARLLTARLDMARKPPGLRRVRISTSQHSQGFYQCMGFAVTGIVPDGLAKGLDRIDMELTLTKADGPRLRPGTGPDA